MIAPATIAKFNQEHGFTDEDVLFVRLLRAKGKSDQEIADVINVLEQVCKYCYNRTWPCLCSRDE